MKPRGTITAQLMSEWRSALARRAAAKCRESEPATIRKALLSYQELVAHMATTFFIWAQARTLAGLLFKSAGLAWSSRQSLQQRKRGGEVPTPIPLPAASLVEVNHALPMRQGQETGQSLQFRQRLQLE